MVKYPNIVDFLCDHGHEYAGGVVSGRIEKIQAELKQTREAADVEPQDGQERERQTELDGMVMGLEKALAILGVES